MRQNTSLSCAKSRLYPFSARCNIGTPQPDVKDEKYKEKVELEEPTASGNKDDQPPSNAIDGKKDTYFALKGDIADGYWQSSFTVPGSRVTRVEVTSASDFENEASGATIYVGDKVIGTLPKNIVAP